MSWWMSKTDTLKHLVVFFKDDEPFGFINLACSFSSILPVINYPEIAHSVLLSNDIFQNNKAEKFFERNYYYKLTTKELLNGIGISGIRWHDFPKDIAISSLGQFVDSSLVEIIEL